MTAEQKVAKVAGIVEKCRNDVGNLKLMKWHAIMEVGKELELLSKAIEEIVKIVS